MTIALYGSAFVSGTTVVSSGFLDWVRTGLATCVDVTGGTYALTNPLVFTGQLITIDDLAVTADVDIAGDLTVEGEIVLSGSGANTRYRVDTSTFDNTTQTIDPSTADIFLASEVVGTSDKTVTLKSSSPEPPNGIKVKFCCTIAGGGDDQWIFQRESTVELGRIGDGSADCQGFLEFVFDNGEWSACGVGGLASITGHTPA